MDGWCPFSRIRQLSLIKKVKIAAKEHWNILELSKYVKIVEAEAPREILFPQ